MEQLELLMVQLELLPLLLLIQAALPEEPLMEVHLALMEELHQAPMELHLALMEQLLVLE